MLINKVKNPVTPVLIKIEGRWLKLKISKEYNTK